MASDYYLIPNRIDRYSIVGIDSLQQAVTNLIREERISLKCIGLVEIKNYDSFETENLFLIMKSTTYSFDFTESDYALIKNEYTTSCGYIHGGNILNDNLASVFNKCLENNILIKDINKYHNRIKKY